MINKRPLVFLFVIAVLVGLVIAAPALATPEAPAEVLAGTPKWRTPVQLTSGFGGKLPVIEVGSDGRTVLVAYLRQMTASAEDTAPYFRKSTNNGSTWANAAAISPDGSAEITFLDVTLDDNNVGHAIWTDLSAGDPNILNIYYARETSWPASPPPFSTVQDPQLITTPAIAARGGRVFVVWAEDNVGAGLLEIYYNFSTNGGVSWSANNLVSEQFNVSLKPDIVIDANGRVHLVWQRGIPPFPQHIMYTQGTVSGNTVNWTTPIPISDVSSAQQAWTPQIVLDGTAVHVSFTNWIDNDPDQQYVHHLRCVSGCTDIANWQSTSNPISGAALKERSINPYSVKSTLTRLGGCTFIYFHGVPPNLTNEQIFGVNSCSNWGAGPRDVVTPANEAAINPQMVVQNNWFLHMVYEKVTGTGGRTVWFVRNDPALYLPIIRKS
ncbi:MAG: hypothetical protein KJ069_04590 [Anaerolineae bacterium]|nr:hypothetical protein [Anaerolineae bacterium]